MTVKQTAATDDSEVVRDANLRVQRIQRELVGGFHKSFRDARNIITKCKVYERLLNDPLAFHDPPYVQAASLLEEIGDHETVAKYYK